MASLLFPLTDGFARVFWGRTLVGKELSQELEVEKDVTTDPRSARPTETDTKKRKR